MAQQRRPMREDAIRWIACVTLAAMLASAATSAVFLAVRPKPAPPPTAAQLAVADQRQFAALAPQLEVAVREELARGTVVSASGPKRVDVTVRAHSAEGDVRIPLVSTASNMLTASTTRLWRMDVTSTQEVRRFVRVADIRRSESLRQPGLVGIVVVHVDRLTRRAERTGPLPTHPPAGLEVITAAKVNELEGSQQFDLPTLPAKDEILLQEQYENWQPVFPVPDKLPTPVRQHYHAALAECDSSSPHVASRREMLTFYYSPQAGTWTPQPRGESTSSASP